MQSNPLIPNGAKPFSVIVDPDPAAIINDGFQAWQERMTRDMAAEGITITMIEGNTFRGYYFPDNVTPKKWLSPEALKR
jgi:hypothetical protein